MKTLLTMFCIACAMFLNAQSLKQAEYFIDKDKGVGLNTKLNLAASADSSYQMNIDVSALSAGIHKLYIRVKDSKGKWSVTDSRNIEIVNADTQAVIMAGEYFFDKDPGYGKGKKINVTENDSVVVKEFIAATQSLTSGYHKFYTRIKDSEGKWSITNRKNIEIIKTPDTVHIIAAEYFFSTDKGFAKATRKEFATVSQDSTFKFKIPYNDIPAGADSLFLRVQDDNGKWSTTKITAFSIQALMQEAEIADAKVVSDTRLRVYPNPATEYINVSFASKSKTASLQIFDENGKPVLQKTLTPGLSNHINISHLAAGVYFVQTSDGTTTQSARFTKQ